MADIQDKDKGSKKDRATLYFPKRFNVMRIRIKSFTTSKLHGLF